MLITRPDCTSAAGQARGSWRSTRPTTSRSTGRRDSFYDSEYVKKIKSTERNSAIYQLIRAWADYLQGEDTLFASRDERILFGSPLTVDADAAIDEKAWIPPSDPVTPDPGDHGLLAGLWDLPS